MSNDAKKRRVGAALDGVARQAIPNTFRYKTDLEVGASDVHCHYIEIFPTRTGIYTSGSQIQFCIPAAKMLDFTRMVFYFRGNMTIATGNSVAYTQFPRPISSIFKNFQTEWSQKAEVIMNYGQLSALQERFYNKNIGVQLALTESYASAPNASGSMISRANNDLPSANRQFTANGSKYYFFGLHIGHLTRKVFPMGVMSSPLYFYIDLESDVLALETDVAPTVNGSYTIDDLRILIPQYDLPTFYANQLLADAKNGTGLVIQYPLWRYQSDTLAASTGGEKRITINTVCRNLEHVIVGFRPTADITSQVKADKIAAFQRPADLQYYYAQINGERIPRFNIKTDDDGLQSFLMAYLGLGKWCSYTNSTDKDGLAGYGSTIWQTTNTKGSWLAHFDFDDFPEDDEFLSGISTSDQNGRLELIFQFGSSGPASNTTIDIWLIMRQVYRLRTGDSNLLEIDFPGQGS